MKHQLRIRLSGLAVLLVMLALVALVAAPLARADEVLPGASRPISEFVAAQGTYCADDGMGGCWLFDPPYPNFLGWSDPATDRGAGVDYAGLVNGTIVDLGGDSIGTKMSGSVTLKSLADGTARVKVHLVTKKANVWVSDDLAGSGLMGPVLFGYRPAEVLAGADASTCTSILDVVFTIPSMGAPLPDLVEVAYFPVAGKELKSFKFRCVSNGHLRAAYGVPDGTKGMATIVQTGKYEGGVWTFPIERIKLK